MKIQESKASSLLIEIKELIETSMATIVRIVNTTKVQKRQELFKKKDENKE